MPIVNPIYGALQGQYQTVNQPQPDSLEGTMTGEHLDPYQRPDSGPTADPTQVLQNSQGSSDMMDSIVQQASQPGHSLKIETDKDGRPMVTSTMGLADAKNIMDSLKQLNDIRGSFMDEANKLKAREDQIRGNPILNALARFSGQYVANDPRLGGPTRALGAMAASLNQNPDTLRDQRLGMLKTAATFDTSGIKAQMSMVAMQQKMTKDAADLDIKQKRLEIGRDRVNEMERRGDTSASGTVWSGLMSMVKASNGDIPDDDVIRSLYKERGIPGEAESAIERLHSAAEGIKGDSVAQKREMLKFAHQQDLSRQGFVQNMAAIDKRIAGAKDIQDIALNNTLARIDYSNSARVGVLSAKPDAASLEAVGKAQTVVDNAKKLEAFVGEYRPILNTFGVGATYEKISAKFGDAAAQKFINERSTVAKSLLVLGQTARKTLGPLSDKEQKFLLNIAAEPNAGPEDILKASFNLREAAKSSTRDAVLSYPLYPGWRNEYKTVIPKEIYDEVVTPALDRIPQNPAQAPRVLPVSRTGSASPPQAPVAATSAAPQVTPAKKLTPEEIAKKYGGSVVSK